ncbi:MAG: hypothetical protein R6X09_08725 [Bacteroidales bacterium]
MEYILKVSKTKFYFVLILILLLPVSKKYKLLIFGTRTEGVVVDYAELIDLPVNYLDWRNCAIIRFNANNKTHYMRGPEDVMYEPGRKMKVIYDRKNPSKSMIPAFAYFYSMPNALLPGILLLLWIAFYTSFAPTKSMLNKRKKQAPDTN